MRKNVKTEPEPATQLRSASIINAQRIFQPTYMMRFRLRSFYLQWGARSCPTVLHLIGCNSRILTDYMVFIQTEDQFIVICLLTHFSAC